jgi:hypothetical protein
MFWRAADAKRLGRVRCRGLEEPMDAIARVVVPGWLGPARLFVLEQGRAYTFGAFMVTDDEFAFSDESQVLLRLRRDQTTIEWPRLNMGAAIKLESEGMKKVVFFGRPFPDAPSPEPQEFEGAATALGAAKAGLGDSLGGLFADIGGDLITLFNSIQDQKRGRAVGNRVRAAIEG